MPEICQKASPIGTNFDKRLHISLGMVIGYNNSPINTKGDISVVARGRTIKSLGKVVKRLDRLGPNFAHICR